MEPCRAGSRIVVMRFLPALLLASYCLAEAPPADLRELARDSLRFLEPGKAKPEDEFLYTQHIERKQFSSEGKLEKQNSFVFKRLIENGEEVRRLIEVDGRTVTPEEREKHEQELREQRGGQRRRSAQDDAWIQEIPDALEFRLTGEETINGRPAWVLACTPRSGYSAKNMRARVFEKMNGKMWVDKADRQLVRAQAETFDTVNLGFGIVGRIEKGTRFSLSRMKLPNGTWVMETENIRFGARMLLVKWIGNEISFRWSDYEPKRLVAQR